MKIGEVIKLLKKIRDNMEENNRLIDELEERTGIRICGETSYLLAARGIELLEPVAEEIVDGEECVLSDGYRYKDKTLTVKGIKIKQLADFDKEGSYSFSKSEQGETIEYE